MELSFSDHGERPAPWILSTIADNPYSNWIPLILVQVHRLEYEKMGVSSALPLLGGAIAGLVGGALNDQTDVRP